MIRLVMLSDVDDFGNDGIVNAERISYIGVRKANYYGRSGASTWEVVIDFSGGTITSREYSTREEAEKAQRNLLTAIGMAVA